MHIYSLEVLEVRSLKARCPQDWFLLEAVGDHLFSCLFQLLEAHGPSSIFKASNGESSNPSSLLPSFSCKDLGIISSPLNSCRNLH